MLRLESLFKWTPVGCGIRARHPDSNSHDALVTEALTPPGPPNLRERSWEEGEMGGASSSTCRGVYVSGDLQSRRARPLAVLL